MSLQSWSAGPVVLLVLALIAPSRAAEDAPAAAKLPVPTAGAVQAASGLVHQGYSKEFADATDASHKLDLAKALVAALETEKDSTNRYALLIGARDLSAEAGDFGVAGDAIDRLNSEFEIDALKMKCDAVLTAGKIASVPKAKSEFLASGGDLVDQAIAADRYELATPLIEQMKQSARGSADADTQKQLAGRVQQLKELQAAYVEVQKAQPILASKPTDPDANLEVGRYFCFLKGDWPKGLANLAQGSDATIKALAAKELAGGLSATDQAKLGDGWWALAEKEKDTVKTQIEKHAATIYEAALPDLTGLAKATAQNRIATLGPIAVRRSKAPADPRVQAEIKSMIDMFMKKQDAEGGWEGRMIRGSQTSQVCVALLTAGEDPAKNAKLRTALDLLEKMDVQDRLGPLSTRMQAMDLLNTPAARQVIARDLDVVFRSQTANGMFVDGSWNGRGSVDVNIQNLEPAALAFAAAAHQGINVPENRWLGITDHLVAEQASNGGWADQREHSNDPVKVSDSSRTDLYASIKAMEALCIARDHITNKAARDRVSKAIDAGLTYLDANPLRGPLDEKWAVMLQEIGRATGRQNIGGFDWYKKGCDDLLKHIYAWPHETADHAPELLFYARGGVN